MANAGFRWSFLVAGALALGLSACGDAGDGGAGAQGAGDALGGDAGSGGDLAGPGSEGAGPGSNNAKAGSNLQNVKPPLRPAGYTKLPAKKHNFQKQEAQWCVSPHLPGPCEEFDEHRRKETLSEVLAAKPKQGDSVIVYPGVYTDRPHVKTRDLKIKSAKGPKVTIFDGGDSPYPALKVGAGGVVIDGFTFTHSAPPSAPGLVPVSSGVGGGIEVVADDGKLGKCRVENGEGPTGQFKVECPDAVKGDFTLKNSRAVGNRSAEDCVGENATCFGVRVFATGKVKIENVDASNNGSERSCIGGGGGQIAGPDAEACFGILAISTEKQVELKQITATENRAGLDCVGFQACFGVMVEETKKNATLEDIVATGNGADRFCAGDRLCFGVGTFAVSGGVSMKEIKAEFNGAQRSCVAALAPALAAESVVPAEGLNDACNGIIVEGDRLRGPVPEGGPFNSNHAKPGDVWIEDALASHNGAFGGNCARLDAPPVPALGELGEVDGFEVADVVQVFASNQSCNGIVIDRARGDVRLKSVEASSNGATGQCEGAFMCSGIATIEAVVDLVPMAAGGSFHSGSDSVGSLAFDNVSANSNGAGGNCQGATLCDGIVSQAGDVFGDASYEHVAANANGAGGNCQAPDSCSGVVFVGGSCSGDVDLSHVEAADNGAGLNCQTQAPDSCNGVKIDSADSTGKYRLEHIHVDNNGAGNNCQGQQSCTGLLVDRAGVSAYERNGAPNGAYCPAREQKSYTQNALVYAADIRANVNGAGLNCVAQAEQSCAGVNLNDIQGDIRLKEITANQNGAGQNCNVDMSCFGVRAESEKGSVEAKHVEANRNGEGQNDCADRETSCYGLKVVAEGKPGDVELEKTTTIANDGDGTIVKADGDIELKNVVSRDNGGEDLVVNKNPVVHVTSVP